METRYFKTTADVDGCKTTSIAGQDLEGFLTALMEVGLPELPPNLNKDKEVLEWSIQKNHEYDAWEGQPPEIYWIAWLDSDRKLHAANYWGDGDCYAPNEWVTT